MPFWICGELKLLKLKGAGIPEKLSQKPSESRVCLISQVWLSRTRPIFGGFFAIFEAFRILCGNIWDSDS